MLGKGDLTGCLDQCRTKGFGSMIFASGSIGWSSESSSSSAGGSSGRTSTKERLGIMSARDFQRAGSSGERKFKVQALSGSHFSHTMN